MRSAMGIIAELWHATWYLSSTGTVLIRPPFCQGVPPSQWRYGSSFGSVYMWHYAHTTALTLVEVQHARARHAALTGLPDLTIRSARQRRHGVWLTECRNVAHVPRQTASRSTSPAEVVMICLLLSVVRAMAPNICRVPRTALVGLHRGDRTAMDVTGESDPRYP